MFNVVGSFWITETMGAVIDTASLKPLFVPEPSISSGETNEEIVNGVEPPAMKYSTVIVTDHS